ncbi:MAG TPA: DUF3795 domain-containing protein [Oscillospiraceae bacterium]|nr:DUF3795 domain-containing protein [Oscillospiraceae bacterium]HPS33811.1 DUF3795 domain-containing protein [Oscillospiraceae bacterium]
MGICAREYPLFSACGLNCGLCPRFFTDGPSRCPGCGAEGFSQKHPSCGFLSCCRRHEVEYCGLCAEYPCARYDGAEQYDSFITHQNQMKNFEKIKEIGFEAYRVELNRKVTLLNKLLNHFDDGKRKSYYCLAVNLMELEDIELVIQQFTAHGQSDTPKEKAAAAVGLFEKIASKRGVTLKLRKPEPKAEKEAGRKAL